MTLVFLYSNYSVWNWKKGAVRLYPSIFLGLISELKNTIMVPDVNQIVLIVMFVASPNYYITADNEICIKCKMWSDSSVQSDWCILLEQ